MHGVSITTARKLVVVGLAAVMVAAITAASASAAGKYETKSYEANYTSAYGSVHCVGKFKVSKSYPGDMEEGGREHEVCKSTEPGGKLTGYFHPGETYTGYWESDYYATIGKDDVQPTSVEIKVANNFKSFKVIAAVYPYQG
jgi:hypothetical protein